MLSLYSSKAKQSSHCDSSNLTQKGALQQLQNQYRTQKFGGQSMVFGTGFTHTRAYQKDNRIPKRIDQILIYFYKVSEDEYSYLSVVGKTRYRIFQVTFLFYKNIILMIRKGVRKQRLYMYVKRYYSQSDVFCGVNICLSQKSCLSNISKTTL